MGVGGSLASSTDISLIGFLRTERQEAWSEGPQRLVRGLEAPAGQKGGMGVCEGPQIGQSPGVAVGTHWCNDRDRAAGGEAGLPLLLLLPFSPASVAICLQGPGASGQAGAPDQAAITC